jgi:transposase
MHDNKHGLIAINTNIYIFSTPTIYMVYLTRKKKKGKYYLYLEESAWIDGKSKRLWQKYLGPEDRLGELNFRGLLTKSKENVSLQSFEFGISAALFQIAKKIHLSQIIDANTNKNRDQGLTLGEYITIAAINRCTNPCSKSNLTQWFEKDWLSSQFEIDPEMLNAQTYWNHFQYLPQEKIEEIDLAINRMVIKTFDLSLDSLFYDPTNFFTFSKGTRGQELLQFGPSKEGRNGNRLVNYSLLCARESGVPIMHETYAGNIQDAKKFKEIPHKIAKRLKALGRDPSNITLVFDKGNHSKEVFNIIDQAGFGFIVSARNSTQKDLLHISSSEMTEVHLPISGKSVEYLKLSRMIYNVERDVYVVLDHKKARKHTVRFEEKLTEKITKIHDFFLKRLNVKKWREKANVEKKLHSMIGKRPFKSILTYNIEGDYGQLQCILQIDEEAKSAHVETFGKTILFTNKYDWSPEAIIWGYREQYIVEHAFRAMKCPASISVRPMFHYSDTSIRAHVFVCVLAYLLMSLLRLTLARNSLPITYQDIQNSLGSIHAMKIQSSPKANPLWKLETLDGLALKLAKKLKFKKILED